MNRQQSLEKLKKFDSNSFPDYILRFIADEKQSEDDEKRAEYFISALPEKPLSP